MNLVKESKVVEQVSSRTRVLTGTYRIAVILLAFIGIGIVIYYLFHFTIFGKTLIDIGYLYLLITLFLPVVFLLFPAYRGAPRSRIPWYDLILAILSFFGAFYFFYNTEMIIFEAWEIVPPRFR